jgi:3-oxoadipate enol-lactonase
MMLSSGLRDQDALQGAIVQHFTTSDGLQLAYAIDDSTDPWTSASTLLLLHAAMGHSGRYYAWVPRLSRHYRLVRLNLQGLAAPRARS